MHLMQILTEDGTRHVAVLEDGAPSAHVLADVTTTAQLAQRAIEAGTTLAGMATALRTVDLVDPALLLREGRLLCPIDHADPAHLYVAGTGLTHLGSAEGRDEMHREPDKDAEMSDSMRLFLMGREGGKPAPGQTGVQPEWFYKGNGTMVAAPGAPLESPAFALDGSEEPEIAGIYLIGPDGAPCRLGFTLANEFSDHVMERQNYLYLAHSKLRPCAIGPTLRLGALPADVRGRSRIVRDGHLVWARDFLTGVWNRGSTVSKLKDEIGRAMGRVIQAGLAAQRQGEFAEAERAYRAVLDVDARHPDALHLLGTVRIQRDDLEGAEKLIRQAIEAAPDLAHLHTNLGGVLHKRGDRPAAESEYRRALELDPDNADALSNLAHLLREAGRDEEQAGQDRGGGDSNAHGHSQAPGG